MLSRVSLNKKVSQLKSDVRSCRLKNSSLKHASRLTWGGGGDGVQTSQTRPPLPGSATTKKLLCLRALKKRSLL